MTTINVFPVDVTMPDGTVHRHCRMVRDGRRTIVWRHDRRADSGPYVAVIDTPSSPLGGPYRWSLQADDGIAMVAPGGGCGCGHPLKRYTPPMPDTTVRRAYTDPEVVDA